MIQSSSTSTSTSGPRSLRLVIPPCSLATRASEACLVALIYIVAGRYIGMVLINAAC